MISVIIPTLNAAASLPATLEALVPASVEGLVGEVIVSDGGSSDQSGAIADTAGCRWISGSPGRGQQLAAGADAAKKPWLLFLHADTILDEAWIIEAQRHMATRPDAAACFRFAMATPLFRARIIEWIVSLRCRALALPYGDQGLLISREFYDNLDGFRPMALMEDVDMIRRIGRRRLCLLGAKATSDPVRYETSGYFSRAFRNIFCVTLYFAGVSIPAIQRIYGIRQ